MGVSIKKETRSKRRFLWLSKVMGRFELIAERGLLEPDAEVLVEDKDAFLGLLEKEANDFDKEENIELLLVGVPTCFGVSQLTSSTKHTPI